MFALLLLHLVLGVGIVAAGKLLGRRGFAVAALAPLATVIWAVARSGEVIDGEPVTESFTWVAGLDLTIDLRLDAFGLVMVALISGIGLLICLYSLSYFAADKPGVARLAGVMTIFAGAMLGVVLSDHLIAMFIAWELTSVTSYLLIGNDDTNPRARAAALQALLITGAGGLVLLAGLIIIGQEGGTYLISELLADPPSGSLVNAALICVLIGAFTKSAQVPFSSWLPGAMVAPTPISAYLHSATMVKAGVYLVARFSPMFALDGGWRGIVLAVGAVTMVMGGVRALRQHDLKLLLAHGTVSQLGFLMLLFGTGNDHIAQAGIVLLIAHGCFKAALFMVVGIVDHGAGTRDIRRLHRFGPGWTPLRIVGLISAASMAGLPPLLGFIAKEKALGAYVDYGDFAGGTLVLVVIVVASIFTFAYSARFVLGLWGVFCEDGDPVDDAGEVIAPTHPEPHAPSFGFLAPAGVLTLCTILFGVFPSLLDDLVAAATRALDPGAEPSHLHLWAGVNTALLLSGLIIVCGLVLTVLRTPIEVGQRRISRSTAFIPSSEDVFLAILRGVNTIARVVTATLQNGSLPIYVSIIILSITLVPLGAFADDIGELPEFVESPIYIVLVALIVSAAIGASISRRRIAAALMLGGVGYSMAGLYVARGAPDLALTQFAIETLSTVLFVLVLRFLPAKWEHQTPAIATPMRLAVAGAVGVAIFVFALSASNARSDVDEPSMSAAQIVAALPEGGGKNHVNVILVDFRGWDTMGEITVLVVAAAGAVSLARTGRRRGEPGPEFEEVLDEPIGDEQLEMADEGSVT
ncbi:MAG: proton-conducting transporter membrane subunit [Acidimicrobiia bacterium]|nr:proton-conducting transporter membrane subunit [Acidimicrobiia bacterium]